MKGKPPSRTAPLSPSATTGKGKAVAAPHDAALELAIAALTFIAATPQELSRFLALTGIEAGAIRAAAAEPGFLGGVLAYIAGNERTLLAFAANASIAPEEVEKARLILTGAGWDCECN